MADKNPEEPYEPKYKGFDEESAQRAMDTVARAGERQAARGKAASWDWVEEGPDEAAERLGWSREEVEESVEDASRRRKQPRQ